MSSVHSSFHVAARAVDTSPTMRRASLSAAGSPRDVHRSKKTREEVLREMEQLEKRHQQLQKHVTTLTKELELRQEVVQAVERERDAVSALVRQVQAQKKLPYSVSADELRLGAVLRLQ